MIKPVNENDYVIPTSEWVNPFKQLLNVPTDNTAGDGGFIDYVPPPLFA